MGKRAEEPLKRPLISNLSPAVYHPSPTCHPLKLNPVGGVSSWVGDRLGIPGSWSRMGEGEESECCRNSAKTEAQLPYTHTFWPARIVDNASVQYICSRSDGLSLALFGSARVDGVEPELDLHAMKNESMIKKKQPNKADNCSSARRRSISAWIRMLSTPLDRSNTMKK